MKQNRRFDKLGRSTAPINEVVDKVTDEPVERAETLTEKCERLESELEAHRRLARDTFELLAQRLDRLEKTVG